jgi:hypothetical protein
MTGGKKFGGGRVPTGTPSLAWSSVVIVISLLAGASVVHNIYKPDMVSLVLPPANVHTTCSTECLYDVLLILFSAHVDHSAHGECQRWPKRRQPEELSSYERHGWNLGFRGFFHLVLFSIVMKLLMLLFRQKHTRV